MRLRQHVPPWRLVNESGCCGEPRPASLITRCGGPIASERAFEAPSGNDNWLFGALTFFGAAIQAVASGGPRKKGHHFLPRIMLRAQRMALLIRSLTLPEDVTLAVDIDPVDLA
jgi:hypothetical protein